MPALQTHSSARATLHLSGHLRFVDDLLTTMSLVGSLGRFLSGLRSTGLLDVLKRRGPLTVFAPTDAAFEVLPEAALASLLSTDSALALRQTLRHHLVEGCWMSRQMAGRTMVVQALDGSLLTLRGLDHLRVEQARMLRPDHGASNGVLHVIDAVLLPSPPHARSSAALGDPHSDAPWPEGQTASR